MEFKVHHYRYTIPFPTTTWCTLNPASSPLLSKIHSFQKFMHRNKFMELLVCDFTPCFLASSFFLTCLMTPFTWALFVGFLSFLVALHTSRFGMKYEIAFLSTAKEFAHDNIGFASPAGSVVPKVPHQIQIPQYVRFISMCDTETDGTCDVGYMENQSTIPWNWYTGLHKHTETVLL